MSGLNKRFLLLVVTMACKLSLYYVLCHMTISINLQAEMKVMRAMRTHMWQSRVEIEYYSVAYFDRVTTFEAL